MEPYVEVTLDFGHAADLIEEAPISHRVSHFRGPAKAAADAAGCRHDHLERAVAGVSCFVPRRLGENLEVLAPARLRVQVKQALRRMLRNYEAGRSH
jgi:hypothetical protein